MPIGGCSSTTAARRPHGRTFAPPDALVDYKVRTIRWTVCCWSAPAQWIDFETWNLGQVATGRLRRTMIVCASWERERRPYRDQLHPNAAVSNAQIFAGRREWTVRISSRIWTSFSSDRFDLTCSRCWETSPHLPLACRYAGHTRTTLTAHGKNNIHFWESKWGKGKTKKVSLLANSG